MTNQHQRDNRNDQQNDQRGGDKGNSNQRGATRGNGNHGGADRRGDATGPLQDGENRGNTTRSTPGGGDQGTHR